MEGYKKQYQQQVSDLFDPKLTLHSITQKKTQNVSNRPSRQKHFLPSSQSLSTGGQLFSRKLLGGSRQRSLHIDFYDG